MTKSSRKFLLAAALLSAALTAPVVAFAQAPGPAAATTQAQTAGDIGQVSEATFPQNVLSFDGLVVVELYADWCGPCKLYSPIVNAVATSYSGDARVKFLKLDGDGSPDLVRKLGGTGFPTTYFFMKDATGAWRYGTQSGIIEQAKLKAIIEKIRSGGLPLTGKYE